QFSKALKKPHVQRYLHTTATKNLRGVPLALATARLTKLIGSKSEDVAARVSIQVAQAAGVLGPRPAVPFPSNPGPVLTVVFKHMQPAGDARGAIGLLPAPEPSNG